LRTYRNLAAKVGTSKGGGKQWQTTPKNLPRMQGARAIPDTWLTRFLPTRPLRLNTNEWMNCYSIWSPYIDKSKHTRKVRLCWIINGQNCRVKTCLVHSIAIAHTSVFQTSTTPLGDCYNFSAHQRDFSFGLNCETFPNTYQTTQ